MPAFVPLDCEADRTLPSTAVPPLKSRLFSHYSDPEAELAKTTDPYLLVDPSEGEGELSDFVLEFNRPP